MKAKSAGTHLQLVCVEPGRRSETALAHDVHVMARTGAVSSFEDREAPSHGIHSEQWWQDDRVARVEMLRARVKSGRYRVDSIVLAECILKDEVR